MNCIYVGFYYPNGMIEELLKLGSLVDFPGYTFQSALLKGLDAYYPNLKVVSSAYMSAYPRNKKLFFKKQFFSHDGDIVHKDVFTGLLNLPVIKEFSKVIRIRKELKRSLINGEENIVLCYEAHTPFLLAISSLRSRISKTCLIVPDLPDYMTGNRQLLYRVLKKIDKIIINSIIKSFDCFVLFSPHMNEKLSLRRKPWIQVEGIFKPSEKVIDVHKEVGKVILYSGSLGLRLGIEDLLKAFHSIDKPDYKLWICGAGEGVDLVKKFSLIDNRINYLGVLSRDKVLEFQKKATLLINPRHRKDEYTRYSFPSKTMEYLASGTPTLMSHLDSIPNEYDSHIYYFNDESIEGMKNRIVEICEKNSEELKAFGESASEFIHREKNPKKQAGKVYQLIANI